VVSDLYGTDNYYPFIHSLGDLSCYVFFQANLEIKKQHEDFINHAAYIKKYIFVTHIDLTLNNKSIKIWC
jgi:hypothetical protein